MSDPRKLLKESWSKLDSEQHAELEQLAMELWRETLAATKGQVVQGVFECRGCHKQNKVEVPVEVPDIVTRAKAFAILAAEGYGKVPEVRQIEVNAGERTLAALEALPLHELAAVAEEAEWHELPPAA